MRHGARSSLLHVMGPNMKTIDLSRCFELICFMFNCVVYVGYGMSVRVVSCCEGPASKSCHAPSFAPMLGCWEAVRQSK